MFDLKAIRLKRVNHRRFLSNAEEIAPTPDIKELWFRQLAGKPLTISVTFEDDVSFSVALRQQFGQIHVSAEDLPTGLTVKSVPGYLATEVAFIPGLVGVLVTEPFATRARRNASPRRVDIRKSFGAVFSNLRRRTRH